MNINTNYQQQQQQRMMINTQQQQYGNYQQQQIKQNIYQQTQPITNRPIGMNVPPNMGINIQQQQSARQL